MDLNNKFLIAMPHLKDKHFSNSVVYICQHDADNTMGIIINRRSKFLLNDIIKHLKIEKTKAITANQTVLQGGPLKTEHGFVLHSPCGNWQNSVPIKNKLAITTSKDILTAIANDQCPNKFIIALGYSSWEKNQIEAEIMANCWIVAPASEEIIFDLPINERRRAAEANIGISSDLQIPQYYGTA